MGLPLRAVSPVSPPIRARQPTTRSSIWQKFTPVVPPLQQISMDSGLMRWGTTHHHPETEVVVTDAGHIAATAGRAREASIDEPRAAPQDAPSLSFQVFTAIGRVIRIRTKLAGCPFKNVTAHVKNTHWRTAVREHSHCQLAVRMVSNWLIFVSYRQAGTRVALANSSIKQLQIETHDLSF